VNDTLPPVTAADLARARLGITHPAHPRQSTYRGHPCLVCDDCGLPVVYVQAGALVVEVRHHGQTHRNLIALAELRALLDSDPAQAVE
jgi:hypothetical protein